MLRVSLLTLGDPRTQTGGYLYHQRLAGLAAEHDARVEFASVPARLPWWTLPALPGRAAVRAALAQRPDVVVLDSIVAAYAAPWLPALPVPVVGMLHQPPGGIDHGPIRSGLQAVLDARAYRQAVRLLAASQALAESLAASLRVPADRIRVVPPGRDVAPGVVPAGDLRAGRRAAVLSVGNWVERKGLLDLLEALGPLPGVTVHLVGDPGVDPGYAARIRQRIAAPDLAGRVVVHGLLPVEQVAGLYAAADVFALASRREPYGTVYGEAMAAGLPVVGWRAGNLPHLARDGQEGLVVPEGDVAGLTSALRRLVDDEPLRRRLGEAARRRAAGFPTWRETAARFFAELRAVC